MQVPSAKKLDIWFGILQKLTIILGVIASVWLFLIKEESSPHLTMRLSSKVMPGCVIRIDAAVENIGGRVWQINSALARVMIPVTARFASKEDLSEYVVGTQLIELSEVLLIGETANLGFNIQPNRENPTSYYVVRVALTVREDEEEWIRIGESAVDATDC